MINISSIFNKMVILFIASSFVLLSTDAVLSKTFKKRKLVYTSFMSDKTLGAQADIAMWNYVKEKTGGAITVDWRFNGSLNSKSEVLSIFFSYL